MEKPFRAGNTPIPIELEKDKKYNWCSCGLSSNQPFCDGSHKGKNYTPLSFVPNETKLRKLCTCKATNNPPYCDGSHSK